VDACGSSGASGAATTGPVTFWTLQDPTNTIQQAQVKSFNSTGHGAVTLDIEPAGVRRGGRRQAPPSVRDDAFLHAVG
jgi:hypothetical protein